MNNFSAPVLFASGDVGGARALLPVIGLCSKKGPPFAVLDHGFIHNEIQPSWPRVSVKKALSPKMNFSAMVFTSSVKDMVPLTLARQAQDRGMQVLHLLDNWTSYRSRMETDGLSLFKPDIYAVMDDFSAREAIKEGIDASTIKITGQPALGALDEEYVNYSLLDINKKKKAHGFDLEKQLIIFVSEPAAEDQGESPAAPRYRGYTERTVLELFCTSMQAYADLFEVGILPHPREDLKEITLSWNRYRRKLKGQIISKGKGRDAVFMADKVAGMASILLYEAWLTGKPVLSIQPQLRLPELRMLERKKGVFFADTAHKVKEITPKWLSESYEKGYYSGSEFHMHESSTENVLELIIELAGQSLKK